ncbi:Sugar phosphate isomerase/epimerase [Granulicella rosea]|uniref:Sugar phosphate isomerase/epimerase n=1 Tax=Granulicella rosea TaxID=474952 RepID=A0A239LDD1_9BACT|nr:sugar phosphate isomerase/epimerase family protein [Granulicella rosea]SNT28305.1 Sugar phosphate isomerase/epimerase [Granulicella rosea]
MQSAISTQVFLPHRLHPGLLDALRHGGAGVIEIFAARHHFDYADRSQVREIAQWFRDTGTGATLHQPLTTETTWSRHAGPNVNLIAPEKTHRIEAMDEIKRAIESAELIPISACVLHLGMSNDVWSDQALEHSLTAIEHLKAFAAPLGVRLLLENLRNEITTPEKLLAILRIGHFDSVGVCLDVGHAHVKGQDLAAMLELLSPRIGEVHVHDNNGMRDDHLWPASGTERGSATLNGTIDWAKTYRLLASLPVPGVLEIKHDHAGSTEDVTRTAVEVFSHQRRLLEYREPTNQEVEERERQELLERQ